MKDCADCIHCLVAIKPNKSPREMAEGGVPIFADSAVRRISCEKNQWGDKQFTSMAVFTTSDFPKRAAENCKFFVSMSD